MYNSFDEEAIAHVVTSDIDNHLLVNVSIANHLKEKRSTLLMLQSLICYFNKFNITYKIFITYNVKLLEFDHHIFIIRNQIFIL